MSSGALISCQEQRAELLSEVQLQLATAMYPTLDDGLNDVREKRSFVTTLGAALRGMVCEIAPTLHNGAGVPVGHSNES